MNEIQKRLFEMQDIGYRDFQSALIPSIDKNTVIGVRTPLLRTLAKETYKNEEADSFLASLPHKYFEENQLHSFLISMERDFDKCLRLVDDFLPFVDNWATCDQLSPVCFYKNACLLLNNINRWLESSSTYEVRFGILSLMRYFLDERFDIRYAEIVASIRTDEYYIKMMQAWYFATALYKQYDAVLPIIEQKRLDTWTHNKAIQKAIESRRITDKQKLYLKGFKIDKR